MPHKEISFNYLPQKNCFLDNSDIKYIFFAEQIHIFYRPILQPGQGILIQADPDGLCMGWFPLFFLISPPIGG